MAENPFQLWLFLPIGYVLTISLETPVLLLGLSPPHAMSRRIYAGIMLTACTYPIVILVLPLVVTPRFGYDMYVVVAETFAPLAECVLFYLAFDRAALADRTITGLELARDMLAILAANLFSWLFGSWLIEQLL